MQMPSFRPALLATVAALSLGLAHGASQAQALNTVLVASGLSTPLFATAPLADGRLFVVELGGTIKVVQGGVTSSFLTVPVATGGEQGLLGMTFDPNYGVNGNAGFGRFFVDYIDPTTKDSVVASYRLNPTTQLADPSSRVEIIRIDQPNGLTNHKGGWIGFKPGDSDSLFIALGDGGSGNDPSNNAQNKNVLLGKMLRINVNRDDFADPNINYGIVPTNPFAAGGGRGEIFAYGLRNPFRNSFDRLTGDMWIADVGQGAREEIDFISAASAGGQNFGWRIREGDIATPGIGDPPVAGLTEPVLAYNHSFGAAITGGYVVRQANSPLYGKYVFADYVSGRIFAIDADGGAPKTMADAVELTAMLDAGAGGAIGNISSFGEGANGELYIVDIAGRVVQVVPEPGTYALMLLGGGAILLATRRRKAAQA